MKRDELQWVAAFLVGSVLALDLAACSRASPQKTEAVEKTQMNTSGQSSGRFQFSIPDTLVSTGRSQSMYHFSLSAEPVPPEGPLAAWSRRLGPIRDVTPPPGVPQAILRTFELQPGVPAVWYFGNRAAPTVVTLTAMKSFENHLLFLSFDATLGKEAFPEQFAAKLFNSYVPGATYGFCLGYGAITLDPSAYESAGINFQDRTLADLRIEFDVQTVGVPDTRSYSNLKQEETLAASGGPGFTRLREQERTIGELKGIEIRISMSVPSGEPMLRFSWHFPGIANSSIRPRINIVGTAVASHRAQLETDWETVLQSFRPVPVKGQ